MPAPIQESRRHTQTFSAVGAAQGRVTVISTLLREDRLSLVWHGFGRTTSWIRQRSMPRRKRSPSCPHQLLEIQKLLLSNIATGLWSGGWLWARLIIPLLSRSDRRQRTCRLCRGLHLRIQRRLSTRATLAQSCSLAWAGRLAVGWEVPQVAGSSRYKPRPLQLVLASVRAGVGRIIQVCSERGS